MILIFICFLSTALFGSLLFNGVPIRPLLYSLTMLFIGYRSLFKIRFDRLHLLYFLYCLFFIISVYVEGMNHFNLPQYIFARFTVIFIVIVLTYNSNFSDIYFLHFIFYMGLVNLLVSAFQYFGLNGSFFVQELLYERNELDGKLIVGKESGVPGMFSTLVKNGYFNILFLLSALQLQKISTKRFVKILYFIGSCLLLLSLFFGQQRTAFLVGVFFLFSSSLSGRFILAFAILSFFLSDLSSLGGRVLNFQDEGRLFIINKTFDFISDVGFLGVPGEFSDFLLRHTVVSSAHNIFLTALIYSGYLGFIFFIFFIFRLFYLVKTTFKSASYILGFYSRAVIGLFILGLTHNQSFATGDELIWFFVGRLYYLHNEKASFIY